MRKSLWFNLVVLAVALVGAALLVSAIPVSSALAKGGPKVSWTENKVGGTTTLGGAPVVVPVSFTASVDLSADATFRVSDSVDEYVTVTPDPVGSVVAGTPVNIIVTFTPPTEGDRHKFHGTLKVIDGNKSYAKPLKLRFSVDLPDEE